MLQKVHSDDFPSANYDLVYVSRSKEYPLEFSADSRLFLENIEGMKKDLNIVYIRNEYNLIQFSFNPHTISL